VNNIILIMAAFAVGVLFAIKHFIFNKKDEQE